MCTDYYYYYQRKRHPQVVLLPSRWLGRQVWVIGRSIDPTRPCRELFGGGPGRMATTRPLLLRLMALVLTTHAMVIQRITGANNSQLAFASSGGGT